MKRHLRLAALLAILAAGLVATGAAALWGTVLGPVDWARFWGGAYYPPQEMGSISGTVTDAAGKPIEDASVSASPYDGSGTWGYALSGPDGSYTIGGLAAEEYRVETWAEGYLGEYYDGARRWSDAIAVAVVEGEDTPNIDFALDPEGSISGTVTDGEGNPIAGAEVHAHNYYWQPGETQRYARTGPDGSYTIGGLATGNYIVEAGCEGYLREYYDSVRDWEDATLVGVVGGQDTPNIDFALEPEGTISGTVTDALGNPIAIARIYADPYDGSGTRSSGFASLDGSYTITGLATGEYRVRVSAIGYLDEYYDGVRDWSDASPVAVAEGQATPNIDFSLDLPGTISGTVTDALGNPIGGARIYAGLYDGSGTWGEALTGPDGSYTIGGLATAEYRVRVWAEGYLSQYYDRVRLWEDATPVGVVEGQNTPGIDFALEISATPDLFHLEIDADITNGSGPCDPNNIDAQRTVSVGDTYDVAVCAAGLPAPISVFELSLYYDDTLNTAAEIDCPAGDCLDDNPDANAGATTWGDGLGGGWDCNLFDFVPPLGDRDPASGPGRGEARLSCWSLAGPYTLGDDETWGVLGMVEFTASGAGSEGLTLGDVMIGDAWGIEIGSCNPGIGVPIPCYSALVEKGTPAGTPGPSLTPTPTATLIPGAAVVRVDPASQSAPVGEFFTVDVRVDDVNNLGAYEFTLEFDPDMVSYVTVSNGSFLGSTGRAVLCPDPITDVGTLRFGCATSDGWTPGPSGSGELTQVAFQAVGEGTSSLDLVMVNLADPLGEDITADAEGGSVSVSVPSGEPSPTATLTPTATATSGPLVPIALTLTPTGTPSLTRTATSTSTPTPAMTATPTVSSAATQTPAAGADSDIGTPGRPGLPAARPTAAPTEVSAPPPMAIPTSEVAPAAVVPGPATGASVTGASALPGAGTGGYLEDDNTSRAPWLRSVGGALVMLLAATGVIARLHRRRS